MSDVLERMSYYHHYYQVQMKEPTFQPLVESSKFNFNDRKKLTNLLHVPLKSKSQEVL